MANKNLNRVKTLFDVGISPDAIASSLGISIRSVYYYINLIKIRRYKKSTSTALYGTVSYQQWRNLVLKRDGYLCTKCRHKGSRSNPLQVDHIKPKSLYPSLALTVSNGRTLCKKCHKCTISYGKKGIRKYAKSALFTSEKKSQ